MLRLAVINGANLNMLGRREPEIYGNTSFEEYLGHLQERYASTVVFDYYQSNIEGELVDYIQKAGTDSDGIIVNAAHIGSNSRCHQNDKSAMRRSAYIECFQKRRNTSQLAHFGIRRGSHYRAWTRWLQACSGVVFAARAVRVQA